MINRLCGSQMFGISLMEKMEEFGDVNKRNYGMWYTKINGKFW